jgi:membrane-associated protein
VSQITQLLISYGGLLLFAAGFAEQSGLPIPGGLCILAAGALAASGDYGLIAAVWWGAAGCVAADAIWFHLGHRGKSRVFRAFPHLHGVQSRLRQATLTGSILHGARMLTAAKFLPFGTVIPLHAGALEVGSLRFLLVNAFASVVYAAVYAALGFAFHKQLEQVVAFLRNLGTVSLLLIVVLAAGYVVHWFFKRRPEGEGRVDPEKTKIEENLLTFPIRLGNTTKTDPTRDQYEKTNQKRGNANDRQGGTNRSAAEAASAHTGTNPETCPGDL